MAVSVGAVDSAVNPAAESTYAAAVIRRIRSHNTINGVAFAICEFALIGLVVGLFGVAYAFTGRPLYALAAAGIVANCLCVVILGVQAWRAGERGYSLRLLFNGAHRSKLATENLKMSEDTAVLTVGTLIPFALMILTLVDYSRSKTR
jgi:hypothetical protein